jgi:hypothetical protein
MDASSCYRKLEGLSVASSSASLHPRFLLLLSYVPYVSKVFSVIVMLQGGWKLLS